MPAKSRADIPPERLAALNEGRAASADLVEWLALDMPTLFNHAARAVGVAPLDDDAAAALRAAPLKARIAALAARTATADATMFAALAAHPSDTVRIWACTALPARVPDPDALLAALRPFAADAHFGVREYAWMAYRPVLAADVPAGLARLAAWTTETDDGLRRFASEVSRPRGVWCAAIPALKRGPEAAEALLTALSADPSRYVQLSVGNWLNDASKDRPDWVRAVAERWRARGANAATAFILKRGLRTIGA